MAWAPGSTGRPGRPVLSHDAEVDGSEPTLEQHRAWLTTAERVADGARVMPFRLAPLLVLTENGTGQEAAFSKRVPAGGSLLVFGTTPSPEPPHSEDPEVRARIQVTATPADAARLHAIVNRAHEQSLWIRFYTLNGHGAGCWRPAATDPSQS